MKHSNTIKHIAAASFSAIVLAATPLIAQTATLQPDAETQKALTPNSVIKELVAGNNVFSQDDTKHHSLKARIHAGTKGQFPKAYILSCIDSRVPVELVFSQGLGDLFVGRVAGNIENVDQLGSMEYAAAVAGIKVIMVLGHQSCGAVKGACDNVEMGNLTQLLDEIEPAIDKVEGFEKDQRTSKNEEFLAKVVEANVKTTVQDIRKRSKILADLETEGKIKIIGAVYSLQTGKITMLK